tara:strand:+ start:19384 stop:20460 length:1077 start_codon:yes stop_codon:yes gene_type:complete
LDWSFYKDKCVLVTGHTGFKGSWLVRWLEKVGANVIGVSLDVPTNPSHYEILKPKLKCEDIRCDINDIEKLTILFKKYQPDLVFHLAAQSIVRTSYYDPLKTFRTNAIGSINILQSAIQCEKIPTILMITSDKCYQNKEWHYGYREIDELGGDDPYSASKAAAEIMIKSFFKSYNSNNENYLKMATVRAGNVVGGGDWALSRIVPDCMRAWSNNEKVSIHAPNSTRPWQHVLEPIGGYLWLMEILFKESSEINGESFNFGPNSSQDMTVGDLVIFLANEWGSEASYRFSKSNIKEAGLLKLNCDKASALLNWKPVFSVLDTLKMTSKWYKTYYFSSKEDIFKVTDNQINEAIKRLDNI